MKCGSSDIAKKSQSSLGSCQIISEKANRETVFRFGLHRINTLAFKESASAMVLWDF